MPPKQVPLADFEAAQAARKAARVTGSADRKLYGETAPLGVKLRTIKTKGDGDCFFSAICKAFVGHQTWRDAEMFAAMVERVPRSASPAGGSEATIVIDDEAGTSAIHAGRDDAGCTRWARAGAYSAEPVEAAAAGAQEDSSDELPLPTAPPTVAELRRCCAAHFTEEMWFTCQAVGGSAFAYVSEASLEVSTLPTTQVAIRHSPFSHHDPSLPLARGARNQYQSLSSPHRPNAHPLPPARCAHAALCVCVCVYIYVARVDVNTFALYI